MFIKIARVGTVAVFLALASPAHATVFNWTDPGGGDFLFASNWSPGSGPPDTFDTAIFNVQSVYTVDFDNLLAPSVYENYRFEVVNGTVTFKMFEGSFPQPVKAYDYDLGNPTNAAHIGGPSGSLFAAKLVLDGRLGTAGGRSTVTTDGFLHIGRDAGSKGVLELNGTNWTSTNTTYVGLNGIGTLDLTAGSMSNVTGLVGFGPGSTGTVNIDSEWNNSGDLTIGAFGSGTVTVNPFGNLINGGNAVLASDGAASASLTVNGTWNSGGSAYIGGGSVSQGGAASLTIGGAANIGGDMRIYPGASFSLSNGSLDVDGELDWLKASTLHVNGDDRLEAGLLTIGAGGGLTLATTAGNNVAGLEVGQISAPAGSMTWTSGKLEITNSDFSIDDTAPIGDFALLGADHQLDVSGTLRVGVGGAGGTLFMVGGTQVNSGGGAIGNTNPASSTSPVAIEGPSSTWTMTGDLTMGNVAGAGAQLVITQGGRVDGVDAYVSPDPGLHSEILLQSTLAASIWDSTGSVYLGGDASTAGGTVEATINAGGAMGVGGTLRVWNQAILTVDGGTISTPLLNLSGTFNHTTPLDLTGTGLINELILNGGTINAPLVDFGTQDLTGEGTINGKVIVGGNVTATGDLTLGDAAFFDGVTIGGGLTVGTHHVTINQKGFLPIGASTSIAGGTLTATNGVALPTGVGITASGTIDAPVVQQAGSVIDVSTGNLALGDANSVAGFYSDGQIVVVNGGKLILRDTNEAVLGSLTDIGSDGIEALLAAANGLLLEPGKNLVGHGEVDTPNDPLKPFTNNGHIAGTSPAEPLTLKGYVKGIGTLDNVVITGTDAPGLSIATVQRGSVVYNGDLQIEIGGPLAGGFDTINHTGTATLNGALEVLLVNGFTPTLGDTFPFMTAATLTGTFNTLLGSDLGNGLAFSVVYSPTGATLEVVNALIGDLDGDGFVGINDLNIVLANWNQNVPPGNPLADPSGDGFVGIDDLNTVLGNWNAGTPPNAQSNIPEPATVGLMGLGIAGIMRRRA